MVQFIKQEASEKAREIAITAEEEFNIEKLSMVDLEKIKIAKEYERKETSVDTAKKIETSTGRNAMRLKVLRARAQAMDGVLEEARERLAALARDGGARYQALLEGLIAQAMDKLGESSVVVRCRASDIDVVQSAIAKTMAARPGSTVTLDARASLLAAPACAGGVQVSSASGKVTCDNTLDARLRLAYEAATPDIRASIFGPSGADAHALEMDRQKRESANSEAQNLISL